MFVGLGLRVQGLGVSGVKVRAQGLGRFWSKVQDDIIQSLGLVASVSRPSGFRTEFRVWVGAEPSIHVH